MAGQEGFEPPAPGFGVRRSTVRATGLHPWLTVLHTQPSIERLFGFLVRRMLLTESAILAERKFVRRSPLVLGRRIIPSFAFLACKCDYNSHP